MRQIQTQKWEKEPEMVLTHEALNKYFEKSEYMNLLQARIHSFTSLVDGRVDDAVRNQQIERQNAGIRSTHEGNEWRFAKVPISDAVLEFRWNFLPDVNGICPVSPKFNLFVGEQRYYLASASLPTHLIEPVYESLHELINLVKVADESIASEIEKEIIDYLK